MKKIIDALISVVVIVAAILSVMHIDFPGRRIIIYGGLLYFFIEFIMRAMRKKKEV